MHYNARNLSWLALNNTKQKSQACVWGLVQAQTHGCHAHWLVRELGHSHLEKFFPREGKKGVRTRLTHNLLHIPSENKSRKISHFQTYLSTNYIQQDRLSIKTSFILLNKGPLDEIKSEGLLQLSTGLLLQQKKQKWNTHLLWCTRNGTFSSKFFSLALYYMTNTNGDVKRVLAQSLDRLGWQC